MVKWSIPHCSLHLTIILGIFSRKYINFLLRGFYFFVCLFTQPSFLFFYHFSYFNSPNSSNLYSKMKKIIFPIFFFIYIIIMLDSRKENITPLNVYIFFFYPSLETIPFYIDLSVFL